MRYFIALTMWLTMLHPAHADYVHDLEVGGSLRLSGEIEFNTDMEFKKDVTFEDDVIFLKGMVFDNITTFDNETHHNATTRFYDDVRVSGRSRLFDRLEFRDTFNDQIRIYNPSDTNYPNIAWFGTDGERFAQIGAHEKTTDGQYWHNHFHVYTRNGPTLYGVNGRYQKGRFYVEGSRDWPRVMVTNADLFLQEKDGNGQGRLVMKGDDGSYYRIHINTSGEVVATLNDRPYEAIQAVNP